MKRFLLFAHIHNSSDSGGASDVQAVADTLQELKELIEVVAEEAAELYESDGDPSSVLAEMVFASRYEDEIVYLEALDTTTWTYQEWDWDAGEWEGRSYSLELLELREAE